MIRVTARKPIEDRLVAAVKKAYDSKEYKDFMVSRGFGVKYLPPAEFAAFMAKTDAETGTRERDPPSKTENMLSRGKQESRYQRADTAGTHQKAKRARAAA